MELGIYTFAERHPDPATGALISPAERLHNLMEEIQLADRLELDVFGVGEHHRPHYSARHGTRGMRPGALRGSTFRRLIPAGRLTVERARASLAISAIGAYLAPPAM